MKREQSTIAVPLAVFDGVVYVGSLKSFDSGFFYAVDAETGKEKWRFEYRGVGGACGSPEWFWNSATVSGGVVYVGNSDGLLYALDAATGKERWRFQAKAGIGSSPVVSGGVIYVQSMDDHVYAIH